MRGEGVRNASTVFPKGLWSTEGGGEGRGGGGDTRVTSTALYNAYCVVRSTAVLGTQRISCCAFGSLEGRPFLFFVLFTFVWGWGGGV